MRRALALLLGMVIGTVLAVTLIGLVSLVGCADITATWRVICRGDSVNVDFRDTALAKCSTLDSLLVHPDTTRRTP